MHTKEIEKNLFLIDLETGGLHNIVASYVLKGAKTVIVEDKVMRKLAGCLKSYPIYVKTVLENSVQVFIEFAETVKS